MGNGWIPELLLTSLHRGVVNQVSAAARTPFGSFFGWTGRVVIGAGSNLAFAFHWCGINDVVGHKGNLTDIEGREDLHGLEHELVDASSVLLAVPRFESATIIFAWFQGPPAEVIMSIQSEQSKTPTSQLQVTGDHDNHPCLEFGLIISRGDKDTVPVTNVWYVNIAPTEISRADDG